MISIQVTSAPEDRAALVARIEIRIEGDSSRGLALQLARFLRDQCKITDQPWVLVNEQGKLLEGGDSIHALAARGDHPPREMLQ